MAQSATLARQDAPDDDIVIRVRGLTNRFGATTVHEDLDLDVRRGELLGVIGGSGTGKSVLLRSIVGLNKPVAGEIEVFGEKLNDLSREERIGIERRWGVMFQDGALFSTLSVRENVMTPMLEHTKIPHQLMRELADLKIRLAGLELEAAAKSPGDLSGGMRKRAALARALALDPDLVFLDEPTSGLDPISAGAFDELIRDLSKSLGLTVFMITHDLDSLYTICDRVAVLADKKIVAIAPVRELEKS